MTAGEKEEAEVSTEPERPLGALLEEARQARELRLEVEVLRELARRYEEALDSIARWSEGPKVTGCFDEPGSAATARGVLGGPPGSAAREGVRRVPEWQDAPDAWEPQIDLVHPLTSGRHDAYALALDLVSRRRSKGQLVALATWLLVRSGAPLPTPKKERDDG